MSRIPNRKAIEGFTIGTHVRNPRAVNSNGGTATVGHDRSKVSRISKPKSIIVSITGRFRIVVGPKVVHDLMLHSIVL